MLVGFGMLKIEKRGKATNGGSLECNDAWVVRLSTPLSLTCSSSNFERVHSLFRGMGADYRRPGRVLNTELVSSAHACLLLLQPWNGSVVTREILYILMGVPSSITAV